MLNIGDKVTVIVDDTCGYGKGYQGAITAVIDDSWIGFDVYEVDGKYEYAEEELELTMKFKVGDEVIVIAGEYSGISGKIMAIDDNDTKIPYRIQGDLWFSESELALKSKIDFAISVLNDIPNLNLESKVEIDDDDENGIEITPLVDETMELRVVIANLESELLSLYRELHKINKDSQN